MRLPLLHLDAAANGRPTMSTRREDWHAPLSPDLERRIRQAGSELADSIPLVRLRHAGLDLDPFAYDFVYGSPSLSSLPAIDKPRIDRPVDDLALYIHLPFCTYACSFCYFAKHIGRSTDAVGAYLDILHEEIRAASACFRGVPIQSVYFGGGTPTYLTTRQLLSLIEWIRSAFSIAPHYEWTIEGSPETLDSEKLACVRDAGINRVSVGVQSFNQHMLDSVSRKHTAAAARAAIDLLAGSDIDSYNIDLIYGFSEQDEEALIADLGIVRALLPPSVTWYQLWRHNETPLGRSERHSSSITAEAIHKTKCIIHTAMQHFGYERDKVDWFVRGLSHRQQQQEHKWHNGSFLGLGASAYGYISGYYYRNHPSIHDYGRAVQQHGFGAGQAATLTAEQQFRRRLVLGIKTRLGISLDAIEGAAQVGAADVHETLERLLQHDLLETKAGRLCLTEAGQLYGDCIARTMESAQDAMTRREFRKYLHMVQ